MRPARKLLVIVVVVAALCLGAGFAAGRFVRSPEQVAADADPPAPTLMTARVSRGTVTRAIVVRGSVTRGGSVDVAAVAPAGVDPVVTRQPLRVGQSVRPGMVLTEVSYRPIIALAGRIPMIRDLAVGSTGPDVAELQRAIEQLGWTIYDADGVFGASTAAALTGLYDSVGYSVPTTPAPPAPAQDDAPAARTGARTTVPDVVTARRSELMVVPDLPGTVAAVTAGVGAAASGSVLSVSTAPPLVRTSVAPSQRSLVRQVGTVVLQSASPRYRSRARITAVGATVQDEETGEFSVPLTLRPTKPLPEGTLDKGIEVRIDVGKAAAAGMIVPITALYTDPDGATAVVTVVDGQTSSVGVTVLETGSGRARIAPDDAGELAAGDAVRVGLTG